MKLKGADKPILEGKLWQKIKVGESLWMIEEEEDVYGGKPYFMLYLVLFFVFDFRLSPPYSSNGSSGI